MRTKLLQLLLAGALQVSATSIGVQPVPDTVPLGDPVVVNVNVSGLPDLFAFQFDIGFNPSVLSAVSVTEGSLFSSIGVSFSSGIIDNTAGTITFVADSLSGLDPGISLDGTLVEVQFSTIAAGASSLGLTNVILLDSNLDDISADTVNADVIVTGASEVPEPSSFLLLSSGVALMAGIGARRRR
jgi:hypothetical protein